VIHEFGHFIVAKLLKIRVETFSFGFGPRLIGYRWGTTDYRVSAIPLGGYVKLGGDESNAPIEGEGEADIPVEEQFNLRPRWQRILVSIAGPVMNVLTALAIPFVAAMYIGVPVMPAPIVSHVSQGGAAEVAGIKPGDRVVAFEGTDNPTWERIENDALLSPERPMQLTIEREGKRLPVTIKPAKLVRDGHDFGSLQMEPDYGAMPVLVGKVVEGGGAEAAGLKTGDRIISINDEPARNSEQVSDFVQKHKGVPLHLAVERNGQRMDLTATTKMMPDGREILGFGYQAGPQERVGPGHAISYAVNSNLEILRLTGKALGQAFTGQRSIRDTLSGPIGIATESSKAANEYGWAGVFFMLGFMSLNLGVFNLLPIPVLDGGAIFIMLLEAVLGVIGLTLSMTMRERIQQVGFVMLLLLMGFVITNDVIKVFSSPRPNSDPPAATAPQK
jgi:regulator of sigma E protease